MSGEKTFHFSNMKQFFFLVSFELALIITIMLIVIIIIYCHPNTLVKQKKKKVVNLFVFMSVGVGKIAFCGITVSSSQFSLEPVFIKTLEIFLWRRRMKDTKPPPPPNQLLTSDVREMYWPSGHLRKRTNSLLHS